MVAETSFECCLVTELYMMDSIDSIYKAVKPLLYVLKLSGVAPFSYVSNKRRGTMTLMSRSSDMFWVVVLFACSLVSLPLDLYVKRFQLWKYPLKLYIVSVSFEIYHHCVIMITVLSLSVFRKRNLPRIFVLISQVDELMYQNAERAVLYKRTRFFIVLQLLITSVAVGLVSYGYSFKLTKSISLEYVSALIQMVEHVTLLCLVLQFINVVLLLKQRYKCLNRMLDSHSHVWRHRTKSTGRNIIS
jgi:hypothetical protein